MELVVRNEAWNILVYFLTFLVKIKNVNMYKIVNFRHVWNRLCAWIPEKAKKIIEVKNKSFSFYQIQYFI